MVFIKLLAIYLPFEEFFLKWLPVSDSVYLLLRQFPDLAVFALALAMLYHRFTKGRNLRLIGGRSDYFLVLFVSWAFLTILWNPGSNVFVDVLNIKALLRYVLLFYILLMLNPSPDQIRSLMKWLGVVVLIQLLIGVFQFVGGMGVRDFLAARHVQEGIGDVTKTFTGDRFADRNDLMGTMGDNISFGYFMMIGIILFLFRRSHLTWFRGITVLLLLMMTFLSGSKAIFLVSLMILYGYSIWRFGFKKVLFLSFVTVPLFILGIYFLLPSNVIFSVSQDMSQLLEGMMNSRLGILVYILPKLLLTPQNIIGFSSDKYFFAEYVAVTLPLVPAILLAVLPHVLEDVYWLAMYIYYGLIGFVLWIAFLIHIYKKIKLLQLLMAPFFSYLGMVALVMLLSSIPLNFLNQAFEVRTFSFYLWLFCGLALVQCRQLQQTSGKSKGKSKS